MLVKGPLVLGCPKALLSDCIPWYYTDVIAHPYPARLVIMCKLYSVIKSIDLLMSSLHASVSAKSYIRPLMTTQYDVLSATLPAVSRIWYRKLGHNIVTPESGCLSWKLSKLNSTHSNHAMVPHNDMFDLSDLYIWGRIYAITYIKVSIIYQCLYNLFNSFGILLVIILIRQYLTYVYFICIVPWLLHNISIVLEHSLWLLDWLQWILGVFRWCSTRLQ